MVVDGGGGYFLWRVEVDVFGGGDCALHYTCSPHSALNPQPLILTTYTKRKPLNPKPTRRLVDDAMKPDEIFEDALREALFELINIGRDFGDYGIWVSKLGST